MPILFGPAFAVGDEFAGTGLFSGGRCYDVVQRGDCVYAS